jgi:hypothetical protein
MQAMIVKIMWSWFGVFLSVWLSLALILALLIGSIIRLGKAGEDGHMDSRQRNIS